MQQKRTQLRREIRQLSKLDSTKSAAKMPREKVKGKARSRKRKVSSPLDSEETTSSESQPNSAVKNVLAATNGGKYVPRFGSAAKKQRVDSETKKPNRDTSEEEEQVSYPISCTQPVGGARGAENEGEWSSTQPATLSSIDDLQVEPVNNSLAEVQHEIPSTGDNETKEDDAKSVDTCIPGLALSQSLPPSPHPVCPCNNENETADSDENAASHINHSNEAISITDADLEGMKTSSENNTDDKYLNLLNPFSLELEEEIMCSSGEERRDRSPHTNTSLVTGATKPNISPIAATSTDSHRNDTYYGVQQGCVQDTSVLPSSRLDQAIHHEPIEESFYSTSSQEKEKQTTCTDNGSSSQIEDTQSLVAVGGPDLPLIRATDEVEALKEMVDLRAADLEESQLVVTAVGDQTAPSPQLTPHARFVVGHALRRPSSEQSSQEQSLQEGTQIMHGLIEELSALNRFILHCKRELETAFRQQRSSRHIPHHQRPSTNTLARNYPTHTQR